MTNDEETNRKPQGLTIVNFMTNDKETEKKPRGFMTCHELDTNRFSFSVDIVV